MITPQEYLDKNKKIIPCEGKTAFGQSCARKPNIEQFLEDNYMTIDYVVNFIDLENYERPF